MKGYFTQNVEHALGSNTSPITLTNAYTADGSNDVIISTGRMEELTLYVFYTMGAEETGNSIQVKLSTSYSRENDKNSQYWTPLTDAADVSTGSSALTGFEYSFTAAASAGTYDAFRLRFENLNDPAVWVQLKETGIAANGGSAYIVAIVGGH